MQETLGQTGLAQGGIVWPEAETLVIARDRHDPTIAQHFNYAKVAQDRIIIELAALGWMDLVSLRNKMSRDFILTINNGGADAKGGHGSACISEEEGDCRG